MTASSAVATERPTSAQSSAASRDELHVRRLPLARVVLEPDVEVSAALEREARDRAGDQIAADDGDRPRQLAPVEQLAVRVEPHDRRRQTERRTATLTPGGEVAEVATEVELDHRTLRQTSGVVPRERRPQPPGLEDGHRRPEAKAGADRSLVTDVAERVRVDEPRCGGKPVVVDTAEVHRSGIDDPDAQPTRRGERRHVRVCTLDSGAEVGRRIEERVVARRRTPAASPRSTGRRQLGRGRPRRRRGCARWRRPRRCTRARRPRSPRGDEECADCAPSSSCR